jgi:hypothetical protein
MGVAGAILIALLSLSACKRAVLGDGDGGGGQGVAGGGAALLDGPVEVVEQWDTRAETGRDAPTTSMDAARDALFEVEPPPGFIPCGANACDPAREFCKHDVGGITAGQRVCWPLPTGCAPGGTACECLLNDGGSGWFFCHACRIISGVDVMGLELDCPGAVG